MAGYPTEKRLFLVQGFKEGFRIPYDRAQLPMAKKTNNHPSATQNEAVVKEKIQAEIISRRILGPFDARPDFLICSPLALVPKAEPGKFRLIHDLSYPKMKSVNSSIAKQYTEVHYDSIDTVVAKVKLCGRHCLMAKTDIENAFRLIPIHADDLFYLVSPGIFMIRRIIS